MKKIFLILMFFLGVLPVLAFAITPGKVPTADELGVQGSPIQKPTEFLDVIASIVGWVYRIFFVAAVLFILFAAFNYLTAQGNPEKIKSAHTQILWAAVAIAVALMAVGAQTIIKDFLQKPEAGLGGAATESGGGGGLQNPQQSPQGGGAGGDNIYDLRIEM